MAKIYGNPITLGGGGGQNADLPPLLDNFKAVTGEEENTILVSADKMEESRAKELAGAVWVYGDHIPKNVNDGTKIQLTREEITRPDADPYVTLADIPASDAETETIVNLKESDGKLHPYLYLSNNYESSNGCLLLRKECYMKGAWSNTQGANNNLFPEHELDIWCYQTFPDYLDSSIKSELISVSIKVNGSIIQRQCFPLSCTEYGTSGDFPTEGSSLSYFSTNEKRIALFENNATNYWTRTTSPKNQRTGYLIRSTGDSSTNVGSAMMGYRPAFCLPLTFKLKGIKNEDGSYDMYDETSSVSTYASSEFTVQKSVSWERTKDFHVRQFTFNSKKQYQTMLEGAIATPNDIPEGQPITELESGSKVKLGVWNNIPLQWKVARDTSDQSIRLVLEPTSVSLLGNKMYDNKEPSNSDRDRRNYGNNRYIYSNIHQWLNATKATSWYTAQHSADAAPDYSNQAGFLSGWSENHIAALDWATLTVSRSSIDGGGTETFAARVALISTTELGLQSGTGGGRLDIFNSNRDRSTGALYWTRTHYLSDSYNAYRVESDGALNNYGGNVLHTYGVRPLCIPKSTTYVSLQPDSDGCYTITGVNE